MLQAGAVLLGVDVQIADVGETGRAGVAFRAGQGRADLDEAEGVSVGAGREAGAALPQRALDRDARPGFVDR